jgi:hypothetical protein
MVGINFSVDLLATYEHNAALQKRHNKHIEKIYMFDRPPQTPLEKFENAKFTYNSFSQYYSGSPHQEHASDLRKDYDNMVAKYNRLSEEEKQQVTLPEFGGVPQVAHFGDYNPFRK